MTQDEQLPIRLKSVTIDKQRTTKRNQKENSTTKKKPLSSESTALIEKAKAIKQNQKIKEHNKTIKDQPTFVTGQITKIEAEKHHFNLYVENQLMCKVSETTLVQFALHKGQNIDSALIKSIQDAERKTSVLNTALHFLSYGLRSKKEMIDRLNKDGIDDLLIAQTIHRLEELGYINDRVYGQSYTKTAMTIRLKGPRVIRYDLKGKGISEEIIEESLAVYSQDKMSINATKLAVKKFNTLIKRNSIQSSQQKTYAYLIQKGYPQELIKEVIQGLELDKAKEETEQVLMKQLRKYWRKYQHLSYSQRHFKTQQMLLSKGYEYDSIEHAFETLEEEGVNGDE